MSNPLVAIASLGGTITMTRSEGPQGVTPSLTAEDLTASVPELGDFAHIRAETLLTKPGASLGFADLLRALEWSRGAVADGAAGIVLVQGTDTLEETGYLLDLYWDLPEPLVVTGAMRPPHLPGADGPANLLAAVLTAAAPPSRELGVLIVLNDEVHAAARVRKSDSTALDAFRSGSFGVLGRIHERSVVYANLPAGRTPVPPPAPTEAGPPRVALLEAALGDDGELISLAGDAGFDGIVISAFGAGHVSAATAAVVSKMTETVPVVFASRTGAGSVLSATYGFTGSEQDLLRRGALSAGRLDARKARLLLWALLAAGTPRDRIGPEFAARDGNTANVRAGHLAPGEPFGEEL